MTDEELIARLRERAAEERNVQRNNEAVAAALMGQRLLFDQGIRSKANSFAVRLGLDHENCAKNDAMLARDWDAAADRIEALVERLKAAEQDAQEAEVLTNEALARAERLEEALIWCSGSADFDEGGIANEGWLKLCAPLLKGAEQCR